jgi:hypothetical protein
MKNNQKHSKSKVRGWRGMMRLFLSCISLSFHFILQILVTGSVGFGIAFVIGNLTYNVNVAIFSWLLGWFGSFVLLHLAFPRYLISKDQYYVRPMTDEEHQSYHNRVLIHYTDYVGRGSTFVLRDRDNNLNGKRQRAIQYNN